MGARSALARLWLRHPLVVVFLLALAVRAAVAILVTGYFSGSLVLDDATYWDIARDISNGTTHEWDAYTSGLYEKTRAFSLPLAGVYDLFGGAKLAGQLLVAVVGAATAVLVFLLAREVLDVRLAVVPALVVAFLPSQVLWSSLILKDAFVWFALVLIAFSFAKAARSEEGGEMKRWLALLVAAVIGLAFLRHQTLVVASWALVLASWVGAARLRWWRVATLVVVALTVPWLVGLGPGGVNLARTVSVVSRVREANAVGAKSAIVQPRPELQGASLQEAEALRAQEQRQRAARLANKQQRLLEQVKSAPSRDRKERVIERLAAVSTQLAEVVAVEGVEPSQRAKELASEQQHLLGRVQEARADRVKERLIDRLGEITDQLALEAATAQQPPEGSAPPSDPTREVGVRYVARGISVMLAEPYPWDRSTSPSFTMAKAETIIWYPILLLAALGLWRARRSIDVMLFSLLAGGGIMLMYALAEGNVGTAFRHRGEFVWVIALLAGLGVYSVQDWRSRRAQEGGPHGDTAPVR